MPGYGDLIPIRSQLNEGEGVADNALEALTKKTLRNGSLFLKQLGLDMIEPGAPVPETNGVPRIFVLKDGRIRRLQEENITVGSREFWETAMLGQVFAYPAGEKHPVQLQAWKMGSSAAVQADLSKPLDPDKLPDTDTGLPPDVPAKPRWYHRLFKFGRNRRLCDRYDRYLVERGNWRKKKDAAAKESKSAADAIQAEFGSRRSSAALSAEKAEKESSIEKHREAFALAAAKSKLANKRYSKDGPKKAVEAVQSMYKATPERRKAWTIPDPAHPDPEHKGKAYTEAQFQTLRPIMLDGLKVGDKPVTESDFASLAMFAALDPKIGFEAQRVTSPPEPLVQTFMADGFTEEEAREIVTGNSSELYTLTMMSVPPRADSGNYFQCAVQPGRESAQKALQAYQEGKKEAMAEILAGMVGVTGRECMKETALSDQYFARNRMAMDMVKLMERDPVLTAMVKEKYEAKEKAFHQRHPKYVKYASFEDQIRIFRQVEKLDELRKNSEESQISLLQARLGETELSEAEQASCAKDILKYNLLSHQFKVQSQMCFSPGKTTEHNRIYNEMEEHARSLTEGKITGVMSSGGSSVPGDAVAVMITGLGTRCVRKPEVMNKLTSEKAMAELDLGLDKLMKEECLDKAGPRELSEKLVENNRLYSDDKLVEKFQKANPQPGPARETKPSELQTGIRREEAAEELVPQI